MRGKKVKTAAVIAVIFFIFSVPVYSDTDTASLTLTGTVDNLLEIVVHPTSAATNLILTGHADVTKLVAVVEEKSNITAGYTVSISSANNFKLENQEHTGHPVKYKIIYGSEEINKDTTFPKVYSTGIIEKEVWIEYKQKNINKPGVYKDTLTFTIASD